MPVRIRHFIKIPTIDFPICGVNSVITHQIFPLIPVHEIFLANLIAHLLEQKILQLIENLEYEILNSQGC